MRDNIGPHFYTAWARCEPAALDCQWAASRMSDFFMRLMGFMAINRALRRHGVPVSVSGEIERETYKAQLLTMPEAERHEAGRQFMAPENQALLRELAILSATESHQIAFPEDFIYAFVAPGPDDNFEFGINYRACGFCKFAQRHDDKEILPNMCGLDFVAYAARGIHLERTQTLAGGANHCNFRFSRPTPPLIPFPQQGVSKMLGAVTNKTVILLILPNTSMAGAIPWTSAMSFKHGGRIFLRRRPLLHRLSTP